jgi:hypothetical protein
VVTTSVKSPIFSGFMSTIGKVRSQTSIFHKLMVKSSADMKVSPSEFGDIEFMLNACACLRHFRGRATRLRKGAEDEDAKRFGRLKLRFLSDISASDREAEE